MSTVIAPPSEVEDKRWKEDGASPEQGPSPENEVDPNIVTWDSPCDPTNPRNWSSRARWFVTLLVSVTNLSAYVPKFLLLPSRYSTYHHCDLVGRTRRRRHQQPPPSSRESFTRRGRFLTLSRPLSSSDMFLGQYSGGQARKCLEGERYSSRRSPRSPCFIWDRGSRKICRR